MASWRAEPRPRAQRWLAFRQVSTDAAPLFHAAGEPVPSQRSGRWHREGEGYAQYLAMQPAGAWSELIRYERIRGKARAAEYVRRLWLVLVEETNIADLSTFGAYVACGLDPRLAVGEHDASRALADELRHAGYRGVLSPSAALPGLTNLTLFGQRYEKILLTALEAWPNPDPSKRLGCQLVAESGPPVDLVTRTCFVGMPHEGYRGFLRVAGLSTPTGPP